MGPPLSPWHTMGPPLSPWQASTIFPPLRPCAQIMESVIQPSPLYSFASSHCRLVIVLTCPSCNSFGVLPSDFRVPHPVIQQLLPDGASLPCSGRHTVPTQLPSFAGDCNSRRAIS